MLFTERLILRKFVESDEEAVVTLLKDADFMVYSPTGAMKQSQAESRFELLLNAFKNHGIGKLAVIELSTNDLIGYCGIESFEYNNNAAVELGYRLKLSARGKGYAFEASEAILVLAAELGYKNVLALTEPENTASQHILFKLGFESCEQGVYQGMPIQYFEKDICIKKVLFCSH
ncbi:GNAT family N-acetyltransferase [Moritella marina ATCC 15381]|uniref:GNAT family N-acetyltransferase n=1 Tax=Moritella marina ATCC 15381 TaxID=1202962 RepID=A0A5J6WFS9_MORMI|nr:GNAT family N-acetyltransferase [Moritella marina]QFI36766.1 GNAT family N-acetyltransferase [Moritella marina ATCC 15381]